MPVVVASPGLRERGAVHGHRDEGRDGDREERAVQAEALAAARRHQVVRFDVARIQRELRGARRAAAVEWAPRGRPARRAFPAPCSTVSRSTGRVRASPRSTASTRCTWHARGGSPGQRGRTSTSRTATCCARANRSNGKRIPTGTA